MMSGSCYTSWNLLQSRDSICWFSQSLVLSLQLSKKAGLDLHSQLTHSGRSSTKVPCEEVSQLPDLAQPLLQGCGGLIWFL